MEIRGKQLLKSMNQGSHLAFTEFYQLYGSFVLNIALRVIGDPLEAEDVCHDIFLDIFENPDQYKANKGSIKAWLAIKTRNRSIDQLRKRKPVLINKLEKMDTREQLGPEMYVLKNLEKKVVIEALKHLPKKQRDVIYGAYFEHKTQQELASLLNRPLGTIKSSIRYGLNNLRKYKKLIQWVSARGE